MLYQFQFICFKSFACPFPRIDAGWLVIGNSSWKQIAWCWQLLLGQNRDLATPGNFCSLLFGFSGVYILDYEKVGEIDEIEITYNCFKLI